MVNERYDNQQEDHEESEYHFSDDQVNYEMEPEEGGKVVAAPKASFADKLKQNRRMVMGGVVFLVLLSLVYKMLVPSSAPPSTDIAQQNLPSTPAASVPKTKTAAAVEQPAAPAQPSAQAQSSQFSQPPQPQAAVASTEVSQSIVQTPAQPAMNQQQAPQAVTANPVSDQSQPSTNPIAQTAAAQPAVVVNAAPAPMVDASAQQNSAVMNLIQTQSQKMADNENQVNEMKNQLQELNSRVANMEVAFHQLTKILRTMHNQSPNGMTNDNGDNSSVAATPAKVVQQKLNYTVQAIIPGRAWLKSDSGDTVTVAEGDMLRDVGRITKIDPYDGIVNIDTGSKIITLSYGVTGD